MASSSDYEAQIPTPDVETSPNTPTTGATATPPTDVDPESGGDDTTPRAPKRPRSDVWNFFEKIDVTKDQHGRLLTQKAKCALCGHIFQAHHKSGTNHLKRHLDKHNKGQTTPQGDIRQTLLSQSSSSGSLGSWNYDAIKARKCVIKFIILKNLPFKLVEDDEFEDMITDGFYPAFKKISRQSCQRDILKYYHEEQAKIVSYFQSLNCKFSLTSDIWTSRAQTGYLCITAHWIDDSWQMFKRVISFIAFEDSHTGINIANLIIEELSKLEISEKIFSLSLDNASNNNVAVDHIRSSLLLPCNGEIFHIRCMCHILNLIVQSAFNEISPMIEKVRDITFAINASDNRLRRWKQLCKRKNFKPRLIPKDVDHRWNSTYAMLNVAIEYKEIINDFIAFYTSSSSSGSMYGITEDEWSVIYNVKQMLQVFYDATMLLSGCYYPTIIQAALQVFNIHTFFNNYRMDAYFGSMIFQMESKFNKYFRPIPIIFGLGVLIDPCLKDVGLRNLLHSLYGNMIIDTDDGQTITASTYHNTIRTYFQRLYDEYAARYGVATHQPTVFASTSSSRGKGTSFDRELMIAQLTGGSGSGSTTSMELSEIDQYLTASLAKNQNNTFDILQWWRVYGTVSYPILAIIARDLLTVQVSTVASESAFSTAGRLIDDHRTSLDPSTVQAVMCLQDWWRYEKRTQGIDRLASIEDKLQDMGIGDRDKE